MEVTKKTVAEHQQRDFQRVPAAEHQREDEGQAREADEAPC
jgi:hypothetical protein